MSSHSPFMRQLSVAKSKSSSSSMMSEVPLFKRTGTKTKKKMQEEADFFDLDDLKNVKAIANREMDDDRIIKVKINKSPQKQPASQRQKQLD